MTRTAARTNSHSRASTPKRRSASGSSTGSVRPAIEQDGRADLDPVPGAKLTGGDGFAVDPGTVRRPSVDKSYRVADQVQFGVPTADPRILETNVGAGAAADHRHRVGQRDAGLGTTHRCAGRICAATVGDDDAMPWAGYERHRGRRGRRCCRGRTIQCTTIGAAGAAGIGCRITADGEPAHLQGGVVLETHLDRAGEGVTGLLRVGLQHFAEGLPQRLCVRRQPFVVVIAQGDDKAVRGNDPTWADHYPAIIDLPLQCASDVRGHRLALEDATKGTFNQTFEASLEAVEDTHRTRSFLTGHDRSRATSASRSPPVSYTHLTL